MTIKKSFITAGIVASVAIAGTGVASAEETDVPTAGFSSEGSLDDVDLSSQAAGLFGSLDDDSKFDLGTAIAGLSALVAAGGAVAGSIALAPTIYSAVQDFQGFIDDIAGNLPALPAI